MRRGTRNILIGITAMVLVLCGIDYGFARLTGLIGGTKELVSDLKTGVQEIQKTVDEVPQKTIAEIQKLFEDPDLLIGKLKSQIRQKSAQQIAELRSDSANWRKIDEIEKQRDQQLERVEEMVSSIREGLSGNPDPIFAEAARILAEQGVDEAIEYLQAKQPAIESRVKSTKARADQAAAAFHASLEPWLLKADLRLQSALQLAKDDQERSLGTNSLGLYFLAKARWSEAEPLLEQSLGLAEQIYGPEHPFVATHLGNLARLLQATNRLAEAEPLTRRALAIDEQTYGAQNPNVARDLNKLAWLLQDTNRLTEAELLYRRALAIFAVRLVKGHPNITVVGENYRSLLADMKVASAEIERRVQTVMENSGEFEPIVPEAERLLGPAQPVTEVLRAMDEQYKRQGKPAIYFLAANEPIAPHLDELLGPSKLNVPVDQPISPQLDELLGPIGAN